MTLVRPSSDSLNQLVVVFQEKVDLLQKLVVLHGSDVDDAFLNQVEAEVRALEHCVAQAKENIVADQEFVAKSRELIRDLKTQQSKSSMLEQHMPSHLQSKSPSSHKRSASHIEEKLPAHQHESNLGAVKSSGKFTIPLPTPAAFEAVPKYIKGRLSYEKLMEICEVLSNAMTQKYKILASKPTTMSDATLRKFKVFKDHECEVGGSKFLSTSEFKSLDITLDAPTKAALGILKHTNSLKVDTDAGITRYKLSP